MIKTTLYFPGDPGYAETGRMVVESGLCLSLEKDIQLISGGYHTSSTCLGKKLLNRLIDGGSIYSIKVLKGNNESNKSQIFPNSCVKALGKEREKNCGNEREKKYERFFK